jgi:hypothetical protein
MADVNDPFTPGMMPAAGEDGGQFEKLKGQWDSFLGDPRNLSAIGSIGMALSQPLRWGDTGFSHASRAIGAGGESVRLSDELKRKEEEAASKTELRSAQATAAEAAAAAREAKAGAAGESLGLKQQALDLKERQSTLNSSLGVAWIWGVRRVDKANQRREAEYKESCWVNRSCHRYRSWIEMSGFGSRRSWATCRRTWAGLRRCRLRVVGEDIKRVM